MKKSVPLPRLELGTSRLADGISVQLNYRGTTFVNTERAALSRPLVGVWVIIYHSASGKSIIQNLIFD